MRRDPRGGADPGGGSPSPVVDFDPGPGVPAVRLPIGPASNAAARIQVAGGSDTGETPDEEDARHEEEPLRSAHEKIDLSTRFKLRPDGSLEPPKLPPMSAEPGQTGAGSRPFVGPGPFARQPIPLDFNGEVGRIKQREVDAQVDCMGAPPAGQRNRERKPGVGLLTTRNRPLSTPRVRSRFSTRSAATAAIGRVVS